MVNNIVEKHFAECNVRYIANSAKETLEIVRESGSNIHIIVINIRIIGINGLEVVRRIRQYNSQVRIILLSEYNYIEFAKEAILLKVDDYILMPAADYEIINGIRLCVNELKKIDRYQQKINSVTNEYLEAKQYIEYSFIYTIVFGKLTNREIKKYTELLRIEARGCIIELEIDTNDSRILNKQSVGQTVSQVFHARDCKEYKFVVGAKVNRRIIAYLSVGKEVDVAYCMDDIKELIIQIKKEIQSKLDVDIYYGIGQIKELQSIYTSYQSAIYNMRMQKEYKDVSQIPIVYSSTSNHYNELEEKFLSSLSMNDGNAMSYLDAILEYMDRFSDEMKRGKVIELLALTRHAMINFDWEQYTQLNFTELLQSLNSMPTSALKPWVIKTFEYIQNSQNEANRLYTKVVRDAIKIIEENYTRNVTLEEVAKKVGVSSQYLSKIFREETKKTFVEWLTDLRIRKAKEMIQRLNQPIKEVGLVVGYKDPNYFSRIFRNVVGMSPSEYREEIKQNQSQERRN